ncbi:MAG: beta-lactamase family protein [Rubrobacteraceae bacterium]|nr:beta-lactamase family protein [Rubrobacteraceae bacterium]
MEISRYLGAVVLAAKDGLIFIHRAFGHAVLYRDRRRLLPEGERVPMQEDTIFDLASLTKLFTAMAAVQLAERGHLDLDEPVAGYLPRLSGRGKERITPRHLLTHTSGLPALVHLEDLSTHEERVSAVYRVPLLAEPGTRHLYGDPNMILSGWLVERVSGMPLDDYVRANITAQLGMTDTFYNPPESMRPRIAATEYKPDRGMVRGVVHDENAHALGGVAGHAGLFSTARDLAALAQSLLDGGGGILKESSVREMLSDQTPHLPGCAQGLGFELDREWYMDGLASPQTAGHTGFTGTSLVIDLRHRAFVILLTNRVHPTREGESINPQRRAVARALLEAVDQGLP